MKNYKKALLGGGVVIVVGAIAILGRGGEAVPTQFAAADVAVAEVRDLDIRAEASGVIEPILVVEVKSKASGEILQLHASTGDVVERGTILAEIDPRDVQNSLDQAEADLAVALVQAQTAGAKRQRSEALRKANVMTLEEYESSIGAEASANATLVRARTNLQLARDRRQDVQIAAPIAGTIIERAVEAGQIISSATSNISGGTTLMRMADLSRMQVRTLVDETDIGRVAAGQSAEVSVDAYSGRIFVGSVIKIEPLAVVEQNVTMFPVLVRLDNAERLLMPGMNADVTIEIARRDDALTVPIGAVVAVDQAPTAAALFRIGPTALGEALGSVEVKDTVASPGREPGVVFVRGAQGVVARQVVLGVSDWDHTEIIEGLAAGDTVMLVSVARMRREQANDGPGPFGGGGSDDEAAPAPPPET